MATAFLTSYPDLPVRLVAKVGAATWIVFVESCALAILRGDADAEDSASSRIDHQRVMESVRAKAVVLHWYGGGSMTIAAGDLIDLPALMTDDPGDATSAPTWFEILRTDSAGRPHLRVVD